MTSTKRKILPLDSEAQTIPFADGEEAWFWFSRCQIMRSQGARFKAGLGDTPRPCDPDDVYRVVMGIYREKLIDNPHLKVLGQYGERLMPPDEHLREECTDAVMWREALELLGDALRRKGIAQ